MTSSTKKKRKNGVRNDSAAVKLPRIVNPVSFFYLELFIDFRMN